MFYNIAPRPPVPFNKMHFTDKPIETLKKDELRKRIVYAASRPFHQRISSKQMETALRMVKALITDNSLPLTNRDLKAAVRLAKRVVVPSI